MLPISQSNPDSAWMWMNSVKKIKKLITPIQKWTVTHVKYLLHILVVVKNDFSGEINWFRSTTTVTKLLNVHQLCVKGVKLRSSCFDFKLVWFAFSLLKNYG